MVKREGKEEGGVLYSHQHLWVLASSHDVHALIHTILVGAFSFGTCLMDMHTFVCSLSLCV